MCECVCSRSACLFYPSHLVQVIFIPVIFGSEKIPSPPLPDHPCSASLFSHTYVHVCTFTHIRKHIDSAQLPSGNTPRLAGTCLMLTQWNIRPSLQFSPHPNDTAPKSPTVTHILLHVQYSIPDIEASVLLSVLVPHEHLYLSVVRSVGLVLWVLMLTCRLRVFLFPPHLSKPCKFNFQGNTEEGLWCLLPHTLYPIGHELSAALYVYACIFSSSDWYDVQTEFLLHKTNNLLCLCL